MYALSNLLVGVFRNLRVSACIRRFFLKWAVVVLIMVIFTHLYAECQSSAETVCFGADQARLHLRFGIFDDFCLLCGEICDICRVSSGTLTFACDAVTSRSPDTVQRFFRPSSAPATTTAATEPLWKTTSIWSCWSSSWRKP